jgi:hypothetical protein
MKDYKQKREVISLNDLPDNAIVVLTVDGSERVLGKRELLTAIERGLRPVKESLLSKAQESARIRHLMETIASGDLKAAATKIEELTALGGPQHLSARVFIQKVTVAMQKTKAGQRDKEMLTQLLSQLSKAR